MATFDYPDIPAEYRSASNMISSFELGLSVGLIGSTERAMAAYEPKVASSGCQAVRQHFARLQAKLSDLKVVEAKFGVGCLLDLDHSLIVKLMKATKLDGRPAISPASLAAATAYRAGTPA